MKPGRRPLSSILPPAGGGGDEPPAADVPGPPASPQAPPGPGPLAPARSGSVYTRRTDGVPLRRMTFYLPVPLARRLAVAAAAEDRPVSDLAAEAVAEYLARRG